MSFPKAPFARVSDAPGAYRQYGANDPVQSSRYDLNLGGEIDMEDRNAAILHVDSRARLQDREEPNHYIYRIPGSGYRDVTRIELEMADIPNSDYIINEYNNTFHFQDSQVQVDNDTFTTITIPIGNYPIFSDDISEITIASLLETELNANSTGNTYSVTVDPNTSLVTISQDTGSGVFNILFQNPKEGCNRFDLHHSLRQVLGFKPINQVDSLAYTGQYCYNLMPHRYIILRIRDLQRMDSAIDSVQGAFCLIPFDSSLNRFLLSEALFQYNAESLRYYFTPPRGKLDKLEIEFLTPDGNPYNFRGKDHFMVFEVNSATRHKNFHS